MGIFLEVGGCFGFKEEIHQNLHWGTAVIFSFSSSSSLSVLSDFLYKECLFI